jgi:nucleoside-diphosphate-sugar epimerase
LILVTGSSGFVGRYVCSALVAQGHSTIALDRKHPERSTQTLVYFPIDCDLTNDRQLEEVFQQHSITTIVHLAAILNTASRKNPFEATQVNVLGSLNLLEAARKFAVSKFIYGSSISIYTPALELNQENALEPNATEDVYASTKRYVETLGNSYGRQFGIQFVSLRMSHVVGEGAIGTASPWRSDIFTKLKQLQMTEIRFPYVSDEALPLVHVEDVANMFVRLVNASEISSSAYDTPSETWILEKLANHIQLLNENIHPIFGQSRLSGLPEVVSGQQFMNEFGYVPMSIKERLEIVVRSAH